MQYPQYVKDARERRDTALLKRHTATRVLLSAGENYSGRYDQKRLNQAARDYRQVMETLDQAEDAYGDALEAFASELAESGH